MTQSSVPYRNPQPNKRAKKKNFRVRVTMSVKTYATRPIPWWPASLVGDSNTLTANFYQFGVYFSAVVLHDGLTLALRHSLVHATSEP